MSGELLLPRAAGEFISQHSQHVKINEKGVQKLAEQLVDMVKDTGYNMKIWKESHVLNPQVMNEASVDWIFVVDTLNFNFWSEDESKRFVIEYKGQRYTGYWSLCAVINRALDDGIPMTDPKFYCQVTENELAHIFRSDSPYSIPLLDKRLKVLHEAGQKLVQKYDGSFVNVLKKAEQSAQDLMKLVASEFQSYNDTATYQGNKVAFYKRAQILIADIWACFEGEGLGKFHDIDTITMFADYRIPQVLAYFEVLEYSEELMNKLKKNEVLVSGSQLEVELRGSSIQAVELLAKEMKRIARPGKTMNAVMIDHYIWDYRREHCNDLRHIPYHKIRCIYY